MKVRRRSQQPCVFIKKNRSADCGFDSENQSTNSSFFSLFPMTALVRGQVTQRMLRAHLFFQECLSHRRKKLASGYYYYYCATLSFLSQAFQMRTEQKDKDSIHSTLPVAAPRLRPPDMVHSAWTCFSLSHTQTCRYTVVWCTDGPITVATALVRRAHCFRRLSYRDHC